MDVSTPTNNQESNSGLLFVGQQLSERRLAKGLSQEQLADRMHLGIEQLAALESGDRDKLPELVFIKAMVRRLSTHLELDADALVSSLRVSFGQRRSKGASDARKRSDFSSPSTLLST
jgi:cytoskeletal protein RodZ